MYTLHQSHAELPREKPLVCCQAHVHATLYSLDVLRVSCICACHIHSSHRTHIIRHQTVSPELNNSMLIGQRGHQWLEHMT